MPGMAYQHATGPPVPTIGMPWLEFPVPSGEAATADGLNRGITLATGKKIGLSLGWFTVTIIAG